MPAAQLSSPVSEHRSSFVTGAEKSSYVTSDHPSRDLPLGDLTDGGLPVGGLSPGYLPPSDLPPQTQDDRLDSQEVESREGQHGLDTVCNLEKCEGELDKEAPPQNAQSQVSQTQPAVVPVSQPQPPPVTAVQAPKSVPQQNLNPVVPVPVSTQVATIKHTGLPPTGNPAQQPASGAPGQPSQQQQQPVACEAPKDDKVLILAVQHLQRELKDANQLISVLSQTKHSQEPGNILLPLKSSDFLKSNQISVSSLYTTMVTMESELREEREKHSNLALEFDREKNQLVKDLSILISESKRSEDTLKKLRLELDNQHEVIRSCQAASESVEKIKLLEEEIIKEKAKVVEEQTNIVKCSRIQKTLTSTGDQAEQEGEAQSGHGQRVKVVHKEFDQETRWSITNVLQSVKSFFQ